ncbi:hypothetical protein BC831DRAFT_470816 [Entophlyctis helioformis]|nr:hypothetical protein BC831DRAFT_470816 [Entophlyctis helioformis]
MVIKSIQLIAETRKKRTADQDLAASKRDTSDSPLPFAKYTIPDTFLEHYRPYFDPELIDRRMALQQEDNAKIAAASAASGTGKTGEVPIAAPAATTGMLTTRDDQREGQDGAKDKSGEKRNLQPQSSKTQKPNNAGRSSSLSKRTDGRRGNNARIEFREVLEAEQRMDDAQPSHQPSDRKTDGDGLQGFGLKVAGARMHFEMGTLGRGTAALGTNWAPVPPAMSIPGLLFHPQKSVTQTLPPSPMFQLPKTQETTIEPVATGRKSDPSKPTGQHGLIAPALVLEPLGEDEMDVSMEDYESDKRAHASFSSKKQPPDAADPISQEATAEWISPDALIAPSPFGVGMQIADDAQTANVPLDLPRSSDQPPKPQQPPESPPESPPEQPPPSLSAVSSKESSKANIAGQASNRKPSFTDAKPGQQSRKSVGGLNVPRLSVQHGSTPRAKAMRQRSHTTVGFMVHGKKKETSLAVPPPSTRNSVVPSESASVAGQPDPASNPKIAETGSAAAPSATSASAISAPSSSESGEQSAEVKGEKDGAVAASAVSSPDAATDTKPTSAGKKKLWKMVKKTIRKHSVFSSMRNPPNGKRRSISQGGAAYSGASDSYDDEGEQEEGQDSLAWSVTSSRNAAGGTGPGQRRRLMSMDGRPSIVEEPDEGELGALPPGRRVSTTPARMRRQSQRRDSSMSTTPAAAAAPSAPDNPALFYAKKWRKSAGSNAAGGSPAAIGDGLSSIPTSSRPSIGVVVSILAAELPHHADKKHGHDHHGDNGEDGMEPDADSAVLATRRLLLHAMQANGFTRGVGQTLYQVVHDIARRKNGMNSIERARFPTFDDPGPPLDATGTPMLSPDGSEVPGLTVEYINSEITRLDGVIEASSVPIPANLRKRGMLLSRVGRFNQAMDDLDRAIQYDPFNSDALWHRHQLYLRQNEVESALRDLDNITENNKVHLGAFQTKARIYQALGIIKLAIVNYSAVIRLKPEDADGYYNRACLFEAENEMVYANEDFRMVRQLDPTNEHAIYNLAIYSFQKQLWEDAIQAFSKLIVLNPENAQGHLFRGRAYASIAKFEEALDDITAAIRILPNRAQYFFHRGCLLRDRNPSRAIQDLSVSILLDDTIGNCDAFYQRAKLYDKLKCHDLAIADYVSVIELDPTKSRAYLNLGILHMRYFGEYDRALYCLNKSIANDPINLQAYLCRGELYQMLHKETLQEIADLTMPSSRHKTRHVNREHLASSYVDKAIKDYSRAIHLSPKNYLLFLYRGRLLLKQGLMAEATMDFHAAFDLNASIAQTFIQRSLVLCFQRKYKQVIEEFDERKKIQTVEDPQLLLLIAKARIRCGDFRGALRDLSSALDFSQNDPQIFLQRGICFEHLRDWGSASLEFSKCIMFMPTYAKAYYHRGLCKLYEGNDSGVADLDLAIMHDDKFFEAFLTRASYHHAKGMYAKGIEDCNEALKLEPTSIRSHLLRGACKCKLNQYSLAINDFSKAINIDKTSHFAFYNRAVTNQLLNDLDNAIKDYSIVLLLHDDSNAYRNRALIYWKKGDHENALLDLYAARDHFPQDGKLRGLLGLCLQKVARNQESIAEFTVALELNPFMMEALLGRGNVYASMGDLTRARRDYARVIHMYPRCAEAYVNVAYTMQTESRPRKAWTIFSIALTMDRQCTAALEGRAIVHLAIKNPFAAMVDITRAIEIHPANAEFLTNRGVIYQALNDDVSALQSYKAAIAADASYALAYFNAANLYLRQKLWEHAATYFDKALEINNLDKAALLNRGICKVMLKDNMGALQDLNRAAEIDPNSPQVHFNRGLLLQSLGKHAQAEAAYSRVVELVPTDSIAYMRRGQTRGLQAHWKEAMQDYTMSIAAEEQ